MAAVSGLGGIWRSGSSRKLHLICEIVRPIWGGHVVHVRFPKSCAISAPRSTRRARGRAADGHHGLKQRGAGITATLSGSVATQRSSHEDAESRDEPPARRRRRATSRQQVCTGVQRRGWGEVGHTAHCGRNRPGRSPSGIAWEGTPVDFAKTCAVASTAAAMLFLLAVTVGLIAP